MNGKTRLLFSIISILEMVKLKINSIFFAVKIFQTHYF